MKARISKQRRICQEGRVVFKKTPISGWFIVTAIMSVISIVIGAFLYLRLSSVKEIEKEYLSAQKCAENYECRKVIDAVISEAKTSHFLIKIPGRYRSKTFVSTTYTFVLNLKNGAFLKTEIFPDMPVKNTDFDYRNVYIPSKSDKAFVEDNFYHGNSIRAEIWRDQIIFLILNSIRGYVPQDSANQITIFISPTSPESKQTNNQQTLSTSVPSEEIAIPTSSHPIVVERMAEQNFYGWIIGSVFLIITIFLFGFTNRKNN